MDLPFSTHQHDDRIWVVDYSLSGDQLAVGGMDRAVTIYHPTTFTVIRRLELGVRLGALAYSPDGKYLAAGGQGRKVNIFHTSDFRMVLQIPFDHSVFAICFAADSRHMAVGGLDEKVSIFDSSADFNRVKEMKQEDRVSALSYSPNGESLLVGLGNKTIAVLDAATYTMLRQTNVGHRVGSISHSLTGKYIAVGSGKGKMIYEADNLKSLKEYGLEGYHRAAFHPDGTTLTITTDKTIEHFDTSEWNDDTPIFHAAVTGDVKTMKTLDVHFKSPCSFTALMKSSQYGFAEVVEFLLHNGADINEENNGGVTALMYASQNGHFETVKLLLDNEEVDIDKKNNNGITAFWYAFENDHFEAVKLLLDKGADIDGENGNGDTALLCASEDGHFQRVKLLLDNGADINKKNNNGITAFWCAFEKKNFEVVKLLLNNEEVDINEKNNEGATALMYASAQGHSEAVKLLLDNGADIDKKNDNENGKTSLMYASENYHFGAVKLLLQYQIDVGCTDSMLALDEETSDGESSDGEVSEGESLDEEIRFFLEYYKFALGAEGNNLLEWKEDFHKSPDDLLKNLILDFKTLTIERVCNILLAAALTYNQSEAAKLFLAIIKYKATHAAMTTVIQNMPKSVKYIDSTFLQDHSSSDELTTITKSLKITEQGGNEILHEMVDDPSMAQNLKILVHHDYGIADVKNKDGKRAIDRARPECQEAMKEGLRLFGTFDVIEGPLLHSSRTACVFKVNRFEKRASVTGNTNEEHEHLPIPTALKCMNDIDQVMAEIDGRKDLEDSTCIIALQAVYYDKSVIEEEVTKLKNIEDDSTGDELCLQVEEKLQEQISSVISKKTQISWTGNYDNMNDANSAKGTTNIDTTYKFVLVFNYADRSLHAALTHDRITHPDRRYLAKQILQDIGKAISKLHSRGRIHGDIKPLNIMREGITWKLIDLEVSCPIGGKYGAKEPSSGYCPPEVATMLFANETKLQSQESSVTHDIWSFGTIIFHILAGYSFWVTNEDGNLVDKYKNQLMKLKYYHVEEKIDEVQLISSEAKDLLKKLLHPDPAKRVEAFKIDGVELDQEGNAIMKNVLNHDFFHEEKKIEKKLTKLVSEVNEKLSEMKSDVEILITISKSQIKDLRKMEDVLLRAIYEADEVQCPTTFIILNQKLPDPPSDDDVKTLREEIQDGIGLKDDGEGIELKKWKKILEQSKEWMSDLTSTRDSITNRDPEPFFEVVKRRFERLMKKESMYFYYVDELTGEPVRGGNDYPNYPFEITKPSELVPKMLPLIQVGMRAMSLYNGAAGVCQMFGFPVPKVPKDIRENMNASMKILKLESSVQVFKAVHERVEDGSEQKSNSLRGECLRELTEFIKKYDESEKFAGLCRITDNNDGCAIWTIEKDEKRIKEKLEERAKMREKESIRQNQLLLDDFCAAQEREQGEEGEHNQEQSDEHESGRETMQEEDKCNFCIVC